MAAADVPTGYVNVINKLEMALDGERKTNKYLQSSKELWKEECSTLMKELNDAVMRAEDVPLHLLPTLSRSTSRNADAISKQIS